MKAKSDALASARHETGSQPPRAAKRRPTTRLPAAERRAQILEKAYEFFSEYGLTAQTRALADACGVSQRLLYAAFPNKSALINAVYETYIAGPFKAIWYFQLRDRSKPLEQRLNEFYREYYEGVLTRRWLRLFLYASLAEVEMASTYIAEIIKNLLGTMVTEAAAEAGATVPDDAAYVQELGWSLHGNVSHLAIRRHIYRNGTPMEAEKVIAMHVAAFLAATRALLPRAEGAAPASN